MSSGWKDSPSTECMSRHPSVQVRRVRHHTGREVSCDLRIKHSARMFTTVGLSKKAHVRSATRKEVQRSLMKTTGGSLPNLPLISRNKVGLLG